MACPNCGSEDWKLASVVHAAGLSAVSASTVGVGVGADGNMLGDGVGLGVGGGKTIGEQQTLLSKLSAPPTKRTHPATTMIVCGLGIYAITAFIGVTTDFWDYNKFDELLVQIAVFLFLGGIFYGVVTINKFKEISDEHKSELLKYQDKKMCLRCGTFYFEEIAGTAKLVKEPIADDESNISVSPSLRKPIVPDTMECPVCAEVIKVRAIKCRFCGHSLIDG